MATALLEERQLARLVVASRRTAARGQLPSIASVRTR